VQLLEQRLDNVVFRIGLAKSRAGARQLVSHRHVCVNGKVLNIPSYSIKPGDIISVREKAKSLEVIQEALSQSRVSKYSWIEFDKVQLSAKFVHVPERTEIPENIKEQLIVELYSK